MTLTEKIDQAKSILDETVEKWQPVAIFAGFSGGDDSLVSTHLTMSHLKGRAKVLHINTGIGIEKTRRHVRDLCRLMGWQLWERCTAEGEYERIVLEHGFPGGGQHPRMYQRLKERVVRRVLKEAKEGHGRNSCALFVTGIYAEESNTRTGYQRTESKVGAQIWVNPCYWWSGQDFYDYRQEFGLEQHRNPVSKILGMSGECLCGAYAHPGELDMIRIVEPETSERIEALQDECRRLGFPWGYEDNGPPDWWKMEREGQQNIFYNDAPWMPLCVGCGKREERRAA